MDPLLLGLIVGVSTVVMLFSGIPIAFGLCFISVIFLVIAEGFSILNVFALGWQQARILHHRG